MSRQLTAVDERSDEALIAAFQEGETEAFNVLVGRYKDQLMNFVFRYLGDYDEADDVVQETFVRVFRNKHAYRPLAKFATWIYTIATNLAKSQLRRRQRRAFFSLNRRRESDFVGDYDIPDNASATDRLAASSLNQAIIQHSLSSIPAKYREVVVLRDVQDLS